MPLGDFAVSTIFFELWLPTSSNLTYDINSFITLLRGHIRRLLGYIACKISALDVELNEGLRFPDVSHLIKTFFPEAIAEISEDKTSNKS